MATRACFLGLFALNNFFHPFTLRWCSLLVVKCVSWMQQKDRSYFLIKSISLCLFIGEIETINIELLMSTACWFLLLCCCVMISFHLIYCSKIIYSLYLLACSYSPYEGDFCPVSSVGWISGNIFLKFVFCHVILCFLHLRWFNFF